MAAIISFMGLDGSGKSTSIEISREHLEKAGEPVEVVRAAYVVEYMRPFLEFGKRILLKKDSDPFGGDYKAYLEKMRAATKKGPTYSLYQACTNIEFKAQIRNRVVRKNRKGINLLVDRYIYDNVVTYAANTDKGLDFMLERLNGVWKDAPKPDLIIYIKTPVEVCMSRKDDIPDPLYLEVRESRYDALAEELGATVISGSQPYDDMAKEVISAVDAAVSRRKQ